MTVHLLALPNAQTTAAYPLCGFTQATIRFASVLKILNIPVTLYASEENDAHCKEVVPCVTKEEIEALLGATNTPYQYAPFSADAPLFQLFNARAAKALEARKAPGDLLCLIGGTAQQPVASRNPDIVTIEYSIGYAGCFSKHRVFQSNAWRHFIYGREGREDGNPLDAVIPAFFDPAEFPFVKEPEDYFVYLGRFVPRKGINNACEIATAAGVKLKIIGHGDTKNISGGHECLGPLTTKERNEVLSRARGVLCPTQYVEPFGCAAPEAMLCGVPVISTDWGGFTDTVEHGETGFRCSSLDEFVQAVKQVDTLGREHIRCRAELLYSFDAAATKYAAYFGRLKDLGVI